MSADIRVLDAVLREHLYWFVWKAFGTLNPGKTFLPTWHVEAICQELAEVAAGRSRRLLITVPPRHLKSICTAVGPPRLAARPQARPQDHGRELRRRPRRQACPGLPEGYN